MKFLPVVALLLLSACVSNVQNFTAISTHSIDTNKELSSGTVIKNIRSYDRQHVVLFIPVGKITLQEAVDNALKQNDADILINVKTYVKTWYIPYIYGQSKYIVEGDAIKLNK